MSHSPIEYLRHILDEISYIEGVISSTDKARFLSDQTLKRSFVRSIEIIGEAARKVPDDFRARHSDIDWKRIAGMRDKLIHDYFGVDYTIVWDVAINKLPELKQKITQIIETEG
ncbi:MAG: DUF86 domain-containing protein [Sedimentisphaerales bacterium]